MKKFKAVRKSFKFEYEFQDGTVAKVEYLEPTTKQIDKAIMIELEDDTQEQLSFVKKVLEECLKADDGVTRKIIEEQINSSNIYDFKAMLDDELGKLKKSV